MNKYFAKLEKEWVEFTAKTISFAPVSGEEKQVADFYLAAMEALGVECFRDGCGNVVGVLRGEGRGPNVMLNGHMDVVPAGSLEAWAPYQPFEPVVEKGRLYGRGSSDMLSGLSAAFFAFREIKKAVDRGAKLPGDLIFTGVVMEEPAESVGAIYLMKETLPKHGLRPDLVYLAEPTNGGLGLGQRGKVELVIEVHGHVAHSSAPQEGINAVEKAQPLIAAAFQNFGEPPMTHERLGYSAMTITDVVVSPGKMYSCVPDLCEITLDRRYVPPATIPDTIAQVQRCIDKLAAEDPESKAAVHQRFNHRVCYTGYETDVPKQHPAWITERNSPFVEKSFRALRAVGQTPDEWYWRAGTDGSIFGGLYGIPTIGYGMQRSSQDHQPQEHVEIADMLDCVEGYTAMLCEICGIDFTQFTQ